MNEQADDGYLVMTCDDCGSELIALHGFLVVCPVCDITDDDDDDI